MPSRNRTKPRPRTPARPKPRERPKAHPKPAKPSKPSKPSKSSKPSKGTAPPKKAAPSKAAPPPKKAPPKAAAEPEPLQPLDVPLPGGRRHVLSLAFVRDGDEFLARLETDSGHITELKNRSLDQLLTLVAGELEDLLE